ncbi:MAG: sulfatase [Planctomycetota bacterium]|nr:sulfatase [Planctomycetota bacterium]
MRATPTLIAILCLGTLGCGPHPSAVRQSRGVLVIAVDALRADHVSGLGYDRPTTPALDRLAEQGVTFTDAWSASPDVLPAHAALLTGCDPGLAHRPGLARGGPASDLTSWRLPDGLPSLAQEFLARGFETAGFADHPAVSPIRGVARGFQMFGGYREDAVDPELELGFEGVATKFMHWLGGRSATADWFAYLEVNDLERVWTRATPDPRWEAQYEPRPELGYMPPVAEGDHAFFAIPKSRWARVPRTIGEYEVRYDGAISRLDVKLGRLVERLRRMGRLENTTIVVVGTFGVSFGEGGLYLDTGALDAADLRVPLVVRPGADLAMQRGARLDGIASLVDLAPTLLDLHGLRVPPGMSGVSHAARMRAPDANPPRTSVHAAGGFQRGVAVIDAQWILSRVRPAEGTSDLLVRSWFGGDEPSGAGLVERLEARSASGGDPEAARARLRPELTAWSEWIERARSILHGRVAPAADPSTAADLRRRGLLGR